LIGEAGRAGAEENEDEEQGDGLSFERMARHFEALCQTAGMWSGLFPICTTMSP
jgi:hypothetical protein